MQDFGATHDQELARETDLAVHIKCELRHSLGTIFNDDQKRNPDAPAPDWLKKWGANVSVKLQVDEMAGLAPSITFNHTLRNVISIFPKGGNVTNGQNATDAIGFSLSSHATRTETIGFFYKFQDLLDEHDARIKRGQDTSPCEIASKRFIDGDLKVLDFMRSKVQIWRDPGLIRPKTPGGDDVFTTFNYQVTFVVVKSGSVTPAWKLVTLSVNPGTAPFLSASRTGTDDLTITMSALDSSGSALNASGQAQHAASLEGQQIRIH